MAKRKSSTDFKRKKDDNGRGLISPVGWRPTEAAPHTGLRHILRSCQGEMLHHNNQPCDLSSRI